MTHYRDLNEDEQKAFKLVEQKLLTWWYDMQTDPKNWQSFKTFWINSNGKEIKRTLNFLTNNFKKND